MDSGFLELKTAQDLLRKLEADYEQARRYRRDSNYWFNFFVTAEHLPEWHFSNDASQVSNLRHNNVYFKICSHIANGGKHFIVNANRHDSIISTAVSFVVGPPGLSHEKEKEFVLILNKDESSIIGSDSITVSQLATTILEECRKLITESSHSMGEVSHPPFSGHVSDREPPRSAG